jgi:formate hydrogenlyase transcriptional activator
MEKHVERIPADTMEALCRYRWPGNVRELENLIERAVVLATGATLRVEAELLPAVVAAVPSAPRVNAERRTLEAVHRSHIEAALAKANWVIEGPNGAAAALGLHPNTLRSRLKKLGVRRPGRE